MPEPDRGPADQDAESPPQPPAPAEPAVPDEDATDAAVSAGEARAEAQKLGSIPYARIQEGEEKP